MADQLRQQRKNKRDARVMQLKLKRWSNIAFHPEDVKARETMTEHRIALVVERNRNLFHRKLGLGFDDRLVFHDALQRVIERGFPTVNEVVHSFSDVRRNGPTEGED